MAKNNTKKKKLSPAEKAVNAVLVVIILAVLGLAVWAVGPKVTTGIKNMLPQPPAPDTTVVSGMAETLDMSVDEFKEEFGLDSTVTGDTKTEEVFTEEFMNALPLSSFAKLNGSEYADFVEELGIADKVTEETAWAEAESLVKLGTFFGGEEGFAAAKEYYGFDESVTVDTAYGEVKEFMAQKDEEAAAAAAAEAEAAEAAAESEPVEE